MNYFGAIGHKRIWGPYDRPPFPIKVDKPTVSDILGEIGVSDGILFSMLYGGGILASYGLSRPFPYIS